jgi:hypothetical protein
MMLERLTASTARRVITAGLGIELTGAAAELCSIAEQHGLPMIAGWDTGAAVPVAKLYVNASDADDVVRASVAASVGMSWSPHVVGANITARDAAQLKGYLQTAALPDNAPPPLRTLAEAAPGSMAWFVSSLVLPDDEPKAYFAALEADATVAAALLRSLSGWGSAEDERVLAQGPIVSIGFDALPPHAWTVYWRLAAYPVPIPRPEPFLRLSDGISEIGVHIGPSSAAATAYARTHEYAVSYRVRHGAPSGTHTAQAMEWMASVLTELEARSTTPAVEHFRAPPRPWSVVG